MNLDRDTFVTIAVWLGLGGLGGAFVALARGNVDMAATLGGVGAAVLLLGCLLGERR